jgi:SsrA-binding protein
MGEDITKNRKAFHDYHIEEKYEAGIMLVGSEIKSIRDKPPSIKEAYVKIENNEVWLIGAHIPEFKQASIFNHEPTRKRKLLLNRKEIKKLKNNLELKGYTLVPLKFYFNKRNMVKVQIGLGKGKKNYDKRQGLKKKDDQRRMERYT